MNPGNWQQIAKPSGFFTSPVYFSTTEHASPAQPRGSPVMLIAKHDFTRMLEEGVPHEGAFGDDFSEAIGVPWVESDTSEAPSSLSPIGAIFGYTDRGRPKELWHRPRQPGIIANTVLKMTVDGISPFRDPTFARQHIFFDPQGDGNCGTHLLAFLNKAPQSQIVTEYATVTAECGLEVLLPRGTYVSMYVMALHVLNYGVNGQAVNALFLRDQQVGKAVQYTRGKPFESALWVRIDPARPTHVFVRCQTHGALHWAMMAPAPAELPDDPKDFPTSFTPPQFAGFVAQLTTPPTPMVPGFAGLGGSDPTVQSTLCDIMQIEETDQLLAQEQPSSREAWLEAWRNTDSGTSFAASGGGGGGGRPKRRRKDAWIAVWKFPWDLQTVDGFGAYPAPVPVGTYPLIPDTNTGECDELPTVPFQTLLTKWRDDTRHVSELRAANGARLAMISTMHFVGHYDSLTTANRAKLRRLNAALAASNVCALACHKQHHAVVVYSVAGEAATPERLAAALQSNPAIGAALVAAALDHGKIQAYLHNYTQAYGNAAPMRAKLSRESSSMEVTVDQAFDRFLQLYDAWLAKRSES